MVITFENVTSGYGGVVGCGQIMQLNTKVSEYPWEIEVRAEISYGELALKMMFEEEKSGPYSD